MSSKDRPVVATTALTRPGESLDRLLTVGIKPHARELEQIALRSEVAVIVFEPHDSALPALEALHWGRRPVFGISRTRDATAAKTSDDPVRREWASRSSNARCLRILVFMHSRTLLVNFRQDEGYELEPEQKSMDDLV